jgi:predicted DNA-binding transcriptional regulator YafY
MLNIDLKQEQRAGQDCFNSFDLAKYTNRLFGMFDGDNVVVKLRVKNDFAGIIIDRFGTDIDITIVDKEWFVVGVEAALSEQFIGWIISLGDNVVIVEPEEAVTRIKEVGKRIRKMYGG